ESRQGVAVSIEGMGGVGKTVLAVHGGHQLLRRERVTRVLYVNLRGFHPEQPSADPSAVLDGFLRLLGTPGSQIPHETADLVALYQRQLATHPTLVVLDDVAGEDQIRPLVGAVPGGVTLITTRRRLTGLNTLALDVLTLDEAREYLTDAIRPIPVGDDPSAVDRLAGRCGGLPLALSLVEGHIRTTPGWTVTDHADRLDERHVARRLEPAIDIALGQSYQSLPLDRQRLLRLLAIHPGPDLDPYAAAALVDVKPATAEAMLEQLDRDHLVSSPEPGRYVTHDLIRAFATGRSLDEDSAAERRAALTRLVDHYAATAFAAADLVYPADAQPPRVSASGASSRVPLPDSQAAKLWLDTERPVLLAVSTCAAAQDWSRPAVDLSVALFRYLNDRPGDAIALHGNASVAARKSGDTTGEALAHLGLGAAHCTQGRYLVGAAALRRALNLFRSAGDELGEARALTNLGGALLWQGVPTEAITYMSEALALFRQHGADPHAANALTNLGYAELTSGQHATAIEHLNEALTEHRKVGSLVGRAITLTNLGIAENSVGQSESAAAHLECAVTLSRQIGDRTVEVHALEGLARLNLGLGHPVDAIPPLRQALELCRQAGYRRGEVVILLLLGEAAHKAGDIATSSESYRASLAVIGATPEQQACARAGLRSGDQPVR
ncbi:tetratricopeptide repeat protein, partial [Cryptosporangium phraense]